MTVAGFDAAAMVDLDQIAVAALVVAGVGDDAIGGRINGGADRAGEVDAGVHGGAVAEWVGTDAIAGGEGRGLDRLFGWDGDCALRNAVELLPAGEQLLEGGVAAADRLQRAADALGRTRGDALEDGGVDLIAGEHRGEQLLALLDLVDALLGGGGETDHGGGDLRGDGGGLGGGEEADQGVRGESDEDADKHREQGLSPPGDTHPTQLGPVVDEQVPVTEKRARRGQQIRHSPDSQLKRTNRTPASAGGRRFLIDQELPSPSPHAQVCPPAPGERVGPQMVKQFNLPFPLKGRVVRLAG